MPKLITFACSVCGNPKGETNHWFVGMVNHSDHRLVIAPWEPQIADKCDDRGVCVLCGSGCLLGWVSEKIGFVRQ